MFFFRNVNKFRSKFKQAVSVFLLKVYIKNILFKNGFKKIKKIKIDVIFITHGLFLFFTDCKFQLINSSY